MKVRLLCNSISTERDVRFFLSRTLQFIFQKALLNLPFLIAITFGTDHFETQIFHLRDDGRVFVEISIAFRMKPMLACDAL